MICETCNDTGEIEVESVTLSRSYYDVHKGMVCDVISKNDWHKVPCPDCQQDD